MLRRWLRLAGVALVVSLALGVPPAIAHDLPTQTVMNAFVKLEAHEAHLVIRVPLDLLRSVPFPIKGREYDLAAAGPATQEALNALANDIAIWENGARLVPAGAIGRLALPSDRSFEDYDRAVAHVVRPMEPGTSIYYEQGFFDARFSYPIVSPKSVFTIQTLVARDLQDHAKLTIRYMQPGESSRAFMITGGLGRVALNPRWYQAAGGFITLGVEHIMSGADHLLFLLCLVIPFRRIGGLVPVITAFTLAHSVTLIGTAYNLAPVGVWFPPFVETAIAASIVYMALENIAGADLRRRWLITGLFGLVHGFGFSYALKQNLQFAGSHLLVSLLSFNVGIEIGQLVVLAVMLAALSLLFRGALAGRIGVILLSAIVAHTGWHWMVERGNVLWQTPWPRLDGPSLMILARWIAALLLAVWGAKLLANWIERRRPSLGRSWAAVSGSLRQLGRSRGKRMKVADV